MKFGSISRVLFILGALALVMAAGCEPSSESSGGSIDARPATECPGATPQDLARDYHPRILRGRVLAPSGELSRTTPLDGWLVETAHAAPLDTEQPVGGARVFLYQVGPNGQPKGVPLRQTTADANGQWCMKLPTGVDFGADLVAQARAGQIRLRRSVVSEFATDIYSASEALMQLLQHHDVDFAELPRETYLNLESIAATAIDLLDPVELEAADGVDAAVDKIRKVLEEDRRLMDKLEKLKRSRD